jgi:hypothetical protein
MRSVARQLRDATRARLARMSAAERIETALALGEQDVRTLMAARGLSRPEAIREIGRQRQAGRHRSRCHESLFE